MEQKTVLIVFGTRPEAIKLAPVVQAIKKLGIFRVRVCVMQQHKQLLSDSLAAFGISPDVVLPISLSDRELFLSGVPILKKFITLARSGIGFLRYFILLRRERPSLLIVQGDTATVFLAAFFGFLFKVPIAHVEAGLRTYDKYAPFPEEMMRQLLGRLADVHFAPTERAYKNLIAENIDPKNIYLVGNTEIDALLYILGRMKGRNEVPAIMKTLADDYEIRPENGKKLILVTAHRRESFGKGLHGICEGLKAIASARKDVQIVYPVHPNPNVRQVVYRELKGLENIILTEPIPYELFVFLMSTAYLILTDSGGIQEAAPSLGKPVLVMREKTERQEGVEAGVSKLVGTNAQTIAQATLELLDDEKLYASMAGKKNPYGDGTAGKQIAEALEIYLK